MSDEAKKSQTEGYMDIINPSANPTPTAPDLEAMVERFLDRFPCPNEFEVTRFAAQAALAYSNEISSHAQCGDWRVVNEIIAQLRRLAGGKSDAS